MSILHVETDDKRKIVAAALRTKAGLVVSLPAPARHHNIIFYMISEGYIKDEVLASDHGFLTNDGGWVRRQLALRIAKEAGQLLAEPIAPHAGLFSEDLW